MVKHLRETETLFPICIKAYLTKAIFLFCLTLFAITTYFFAGQSTLVQIVSVFIGLTALLGLLTATKILLLRDRYALRIDGRGIHETTTSDSRTFLWGDIKAIGIKNTPVGERIALEWTKARVTSGQYTAHLWQNYRLGNHELLDQINYHRDQAEM